MNVTRKGRRPPWWLTTVLIGGALTLLFWHRGGIVYPNVTMPHNAVREFHLIEGASHAIHPYSPQVLTIPANREVAVQLTDYLGGCGLVTVFPRLGPRGTTARIDVPIGDTRIIDLRAPKAGTYPYHCAGDMYFGTIEAR